MSNSTANLESEVNNGATNDENVSSDEQIIDIINQSTISEEVNSTDETQTKPSPSTARHASQTAIGAKVIKKLETLANSTENKQSNGKASSSTTNNNGSTTATNETESRRIITKAAKSIMKNLNDPDHQKNLMTLATKIAELQEQNRVTQVKTADLEKRSTNIMRERDQALLENGRITAAKSKLESLCRELHRHNQEIREESAQSQREDEAKRRDLATKFQTTIDDIASQLSNYSEKSTSLREQNVELSEKLATVVKDYELREKEVETALKKRELELRLTEASLEQSHSLLNERSDLIKQERQVSEAERLVLYKKCEELASSELNLRSQVQMYSERYQEFQTAIQQSSQMVTSCHAEMEKMRKKIKKLEKERNDFRHRWEITEQNTRKASEDFKLLEKEKRQLETKLEMLDKLSRALQQERSELQTTIKNLKAGTPPANNTVTSSNENQSANSNAPVNGHGTQKNESTDSSDPVVSQSTNLYDSELGRMANTVD